MDLIQWLLLISENVLQTIAQIEQLVQGTKQSSIKLIPILDQNQKAISIEEKPAKPKSYVSNK